MRVPIAGEPGHPERDNEDFTAAAPGLLPWSTGPALRQAIESGCVHSVSWYARNPGGLPGGCASLACSAMLQQFLRGRSLISARMYLRAWTHGSHLRKYPVIRPINPSK